MRVSVRPECTFHPLQELVEFSADKRCTWRTEMLKGFNYPLTPKGKSTLNPPPPWYYSADFLNIEFWSDPSVVAALLPAGLDLDASANGHCNALFYDWQFSGENEEYLDPARYQYREFFILVDAVCEAAGFVSSAVERR